jgi:hypothetical protein
MPGGETWDFVAAAGGAADIPDPAHAAARSSSAPLLCRRVST